MLTQDSPRRRNGLIAALVMAVALVVPAGTVAATETELADIEQVAPTVDELRTIADDLTVANDALAADNTALQQTVDELARERDELRASLSRFDDLYSPLEADRQLLFELRKDLPETRPEAEAQLKRIRALALASDPARLGQLVDRIDDTAPAFLDWRFGEWANAQELSAAYVETGANAFESSMDDFRSEVLMSVANRLDGLLTILDRVR
jgi:hypothetical protein